MFDEEAERSKLSALDLTDDVIEMILKKKRSKYEERCPPTPVLNPQPPTPPLPVPDPQPPTPTPSAGGNPAPLRPPTASGIAPELREEEEPVVVVVPPVAKKHFHLWHRKF